MSERDDLRCARCGARMAPEQDWCLECGTAANTRIMRPPGFGLPIAIVLAVVAVVAVALVLAIGAVSDDAERAVSTTPASTAASGTKRKPATTPAKTTSTASTSTATTRTTPTTATSTTPGAAAATGADGAVPLWKKGDEAYAVVALTTSDKAEAEAAARKLITSGEDAGILRSDDYDFFSPGAWVVWVGGYADKSEAEALNSRLETGDGGGYVTLVRARGGSGSGQ